MGVGEDGWDPAWEEPEPPRSGNVGARGGAPGSRSAQQPETWEAFWNETCAANAANAAKAAGSAGYANISTLFTTFYSHIRPARNAYTENRRRCCSDVRTRVGPSLSRDSRSLSYRHRTGLRKRREAAGHSGTGCRQMAHRQHAALAARHAR